MPTVRASRELLAPIEDVWDFVAEPHNLPNWWPRVGGVHPDRRGLAPGAARCDRLGVRYQIVSMPGISEDIALLLAYEKGAELIVAVGTHFNLIEFLERDRAGMSSTFVTRLKVGEILVDAKGVSRLFSRRVGLWPFVLFAFAGLMAVVVAILVSPTLRHLIELIGIRLRDLVS